MDLRRKCCVRVLLGVVVVGCGLTGGTAAAQPNGDVGAQGSVLYRAGVKAREDNRADDARAFFLAAWRIKQHWQIAANLADAELETSRHRDAAEHCEFALRAGRDELSPLERQRIEELLTKAKTSVGALTVEVDVPEAEVLVDGKSVGKAPLPGPIFVEPGARTIEARREGYAPGTEKRQVAAGSSGQVVLKLQRLPAAQLGQGDGGAEGGARRLSTGFQMPSSSDRAGPNRAVLIAGVVGATVAAGVGLTSIGIAGSADKTDTATWQRFGYLGLWSLAGAGAIGIATGLYAVASSGSTSKTEARATIRVGASPGGLVVTGTF